MDHLFEEDVRGSDIVVAGVVVISGREWAGPADGMGILSGW